MHTYTHVREEEGNLTIDTGAGYVHRTYNLGQSLCTPSLPALQVLGAAAPGRSPRHTGARRPFASEGPNRPCPGFKSPVSAPPHTKSAQEQTRR